MVHSKKLKVGIAGFGATGKRRYNVLHSHPDVEVSAICDNDHKALENVDSDIKIFSSHSQMLKIPLDIIFVCLPNYLAPEITIKSLGKLSGHKRCCSKNQSTCCCSNFSPGTSNEIPGG